MSETPSTGNSAGERPAGNGQQGVELDFRLFAEMLPHLVWSARADGVSDFYNQHFLDYLGKTLEEMQGWTWAETLHPDDRQRSIDKWIAAFTSGTEYCEEYRIRRAADGMYLWHEGRAMPLRDAAGKIVRWFGTCTDIEERKQLELQLRESEAKYRELHGSMMDAFVSVDMSGRLLEFNSAYQQLLGYTGDELRSMTYVDLTPARWHDFEARIVAEQVLPRGYTEVYEKEYRRKDGTLVPIELRTSLLRSADGEPAFMWAIIRDVSARKRIEERLQESEERFRSIAELSPDIISILTADGVLTYNSPAAQTIHGYTQEEMVGRNTFELIHPDDQAQVRVFTEKIFSDQSRPHSVQYRYRNKDGTYTWIEATVSNLLDNPHVKGVVAFSRDISERKRTEEALLEREQRLNFYVDNSPMATIEWDADFGVTRWSAEAEKIFGWTAEETIGKAIMDLNIIYTDDIPQVAMVVDELRKGSDRYILSANRNYTRDGRVISCEWFNTILRNLQGEMVAVLSQVMDVTERKRTEAEREQYFQFFSASPDLLCLAGADGYFRKVNPSFVRVLGHAEQDLLARPYLDFVHPDDRHETLEVMKQARSETKAIKDFHNRYLCSDGSYRWLSWNAYFREEDQIFFGLARDVTGQKLLGEALRQSEQRYRAIVESQTEYVSRFLPGGILTYVNPALAKWYGAKPEDLVGQSFYPFLREQDREDVIGKIESLTCDGPAVTLEVAISSRNGELRWQQWTDHAICDAQDRIVEYQGVGRDITEKKEAELFLARAKEALEQQVAERTASLTLANAQLNREIEERRRIEQDLRDHQRQLEAMSLEVSLAADRERARIAGELHDEVGQRLMLSRIKLDALATVCTESEHAQALQELQQLVDQTITDIRSLTFQLRPPLLASAGLVAAVQWLGEELKQNYGLATEIRHDASPIDFPYETKAAIFQVVRELLLNVAKHADTDRAIVSFKSAVNAFTIVVEDYGVGCDVVSVLAEHGSPEGFGLFNVQQRIRHLGGRLDFDSMPGKGSRATIMLPLSLAIVRDRS